MLVYWVSLFGGLSPSFFSCSWVFLLPPRIHRRAVYILYCCLHVFPHVCMYVHQEQRLARQYLHCGQLFGPAAAQAVQRVAIILVSCEAGDPVSGSFPPQLRPAVTQAVQ